MLADRSAISLANSETGQLTMDNHGQTPSRDAASHTARLCERLSRGSWDLRWGPPRSV
jgi:hypothetical protein